MTNLEKLHTQITKEQRRIEMLKNTPSSGYPDFFDFIDSEIKQAKALIAKLQKEFNLEYEQN